MKIGILTFQHSVNFGAQLQCYALQEVLKQMGNEVEVIQYAPKGKSKLPFYRGIGVRNNGLLKAIKLMYVRKVYSDRMVKRFEAYKSHHLKLTAKCNLDSIGEITKDFDAIFVGSDQVWGPAFHKEATYFVGWSPDFKGKKISYAPCCALNHVEDENRKSLINLLKDFDTISVRNLETQSFVNGLIDFKPPLVLDPTFLLDFFNFKDNLPKPYEKYILVYVIGNEIDGGHKNMIKEIKKVRGNLPVVVAVLSKNHPKVFSWSDKTYWTLTPDEWVSLLANSDFFYTDSFHGAVFAYKFNKPFIAYYVDERRKSRFLDLAKRFHLEKEIITSVKDAAERRSICKGSPDFRNTSKFVEKEILKSKLYIKSALE